MRLRLICAAASIVLFAVLFIFLLHSRGAGREGQQGAAQGAAVVLYSEIFSGQQQSAADPESSRAAQPTAAQGSQSAQSPAIAQEAASGGAGDFTIGSASSAAGAYEDVLIAHLRRFQRFPETARRQGLSGDVGLILRLSARGELLSMAVEHSAGAQVLDYEALATVRRAEPLPPPRDAGTEKIVRVTLRFVPVAADSARTLVDAADTAP